MLTFPAFLPSQDPTGVSSKKEPRCCCAAAAQGSANLRSMSRCLGRSPGPHRRAPLMRSNASRSSSPSPDSAS